MNFSADDSYLVESSNTDENTMPPPLSQYQDFNSNRKLPVLDFEKYDCVLRKIITNKSLERQAKRYFHN